MGREWVDVSPARLGGFDRSTRDCVASATAQALAFNQNDMTSAVSVINGSFLAGVSLPCGTDCAYATPLPETGSAWIRCAHPSRDHYAARVDRECGRFCPRGQGAIASFEANDPQEPRARWVSETNG